MNSENVTVLASVATWQERDERTIGIIGMLAESCTVMALVLRWTRRS